MMKLRGTKIGIALAPSATLAALVAAGPAAAETRAPWSVPTIDPADFVPRVTNPFLPLVPGTTLIYDGVIKDGTTPQVDTFAVTHRHKAVMGVDCTVVRDTVTSQGRSVERTFNWLAHDRQGSVWYMGSCPAVVNGAQPGLMMEAHPRNDDAYWQFHWPGHALDYARVLGDGGSLDLRYANFKPHLADPGAVTARAGRDIGYGKEQAASGSKERIELVRVIHH